MKEKRDVRMGRLLLGQRRRQKSDPDQKIPGEFFRPVEGLLEKVAKKHLHKDHYKDGHPKNDQDPFQALAHPLHCRTSHPRSLGPPLHPRRGGPARLFSRFLNQIEKLLAEYGLILFPDRGHSTFKKLILRGVDLHALRFQLGQEVLT